ncbi:MAG: hypothetical protein IPH53_18170 [Flavobacteriales bacterium]|nr:hypothetical protein [Flavobacteriales bacterium]
MIEDLGALLARTFAPAHGQQLLALRLGQYDIGLAVVVEVVAVQMQRRFERAVEFAVPADVAAYQVLVAIPIEVGGDQTVPPAFRVLEPIWGGARSEGAALL